MLSVARTFAIALKEVQQMLRDRLTFAMAVGVPVLQLVLFGYAINTDPKGLPAAVVSQDTSPMARSVVAALQTSGYFRIVESGIAESRGDALLERGDIQFLIVVPDDFGARIVRGERPALLVAADATDPSASGNAIAALNQLAQTALNRELRGPLATLAPRPAPFEVRIQRRYNPEGLTRYNIVPGLLGVILSLTLVMMTALSVTRENERGTMESLLATPAEPIEVMIGTKIGMVKSAIPTQSRNMPRMNKSDIMNRSTITGSSEIPVIIAETNLIPPMRLNTPTSAVAPMPIQTIMPTV